MLPPMSMEPWLRPKSFTRVCRWHQLLSGSLGLPNGRLSRVSLRLGRDIYIIYLSLFWTIIIICTTSWSQYSVLNCPHPSRGFLTSPIYHSHLCPSVICILMYINYTQYFKLLQISWWNPFVSSLNYFSSIKCSFCKFKSTTFIILGQSLNVLDLNFVIELVIFWAR